ncbi:hypothetical protein NIES4072_65830 [Nostoc commune NIES-4072]|uniref:DNA-damage-inducible protein D n=1 Tax=Nostoc commune NIES-4072 TaxID=2005467 RepID=A0A2R5G494_NOSCO|nr:hypothetical protein [Nostoc commune]BBD70217.1 hypothetical protein NIES4070_66280 [Nostoc commune HK-02]GBG22871.1 hypothetical protein NIES4072_65830 [Nostoc commune NIES-4072]
MSAIEITEIIKQISQEIEVDSNGHGKASIKATARLAGVDDESIRKALKSSADLVPSKLAKELMLQGFSAADLSQWRTDGIPDIAMPAAGGYANAIILEYYAYEAGRYCTKQARLVCRSFNTIGIRAWIQDKLGWTKPASNSETAMTQIQLLAAIAQQMAQQEQHLLQQQQQQTEILHRLKAVEVEQDRVNTPCGHKYSVVGFANLQGLEISVKEAGTKGRKASALCRKQGIEIERIHDPRFGKVGLYPESVLIEVFSTGQN